MAQRIWDCGGNSFYFFVRWQHRDRAALQRRAPSLGFSPSTARNVMMSRECEIQSPLGAGGMGEVYRALDTRLNRMVAIKVLASHLFNSPELKQRMEREARAISLV
jgi:hypothetical protein